MNTWIRTLACLSLIGLSLAHANGGDVVVCPEGTKLLDAREMERHNLTLDLNGSTIRSKVLQTIWKVEQLDEFRAKKLKTYSLELLEDVEKYEGGESDLMNVEFTSRTLSDVQDSMEISIPEGCTKEQLVTQIDPVFPHDKRYTISQKYWGQLDLDQKALTVLHEAWYRTFIEEGAIDSRFARYVNGLFASREKSSMTLRDYFLTLELSKRIGSFGKGKQAPVYFSFKDEVFILGEKEKDLFCNPSLCLRLNKEGHLESFEIHLLDSPLHALILAEANLELKINTEYDNLRWVTYHFNHTKKLERIQSYGYKVTLNGKVVARRWNPFAYEFTFRIVWKNGVPVFEYVSK